LTLAHRAMWILANGPIPGGAFVCHVCDVKTCVNPAHLFLGDALQNMRDMAAKGRDLIGRRAQADKLRALTDAQATIVIASPLSFGKLAKQFGVSRGTIQHIKQRHTYRHLS
jgi:HNH endonuclease